MLSLFTPCLFTGSLSAFGLPPSFNHRCRSFAYSLICVPINRGTSARFSVELLSGL
ncbi:hypothetical protein M758_UG048600 [Ceratodon purpureus]|nr:hypothetical protein M758_UG048600 [Ceratodon purpureus]